MPNISSLEDQASVKGEVTAWRDIDKVISLL